MEQDSDPFAPKSEMQQRTGAAFDRGVGNMVNSGITAWMAVATGSPESAALIGGMAGPVAEEISYAVRRSLGFQVVRGERMIEDAAGIADTSVDDLLEKLTEDPHKMEFLLRALEAASHATTESKLNLISEMLAVGALAHDQAVVDEQSIAIETVGSLDPPHIRLLLILGAPSPTWWSDKLDRARFRNAWSEEKITESDPGLRNALPALVARLNSLGLVRDVGSLVSKGILWERTEFGATCIGALEKKAELTKPSVSNLGVGNE